MTSSHYQPVRGTHDKMTQACLHANWIITCGTQVAQRANFHEISPPLLEYKRVFTRSSGALSDIVAKEMYELRRRDENFETHETEDDIVLRPEATASVVRALLHQRKANPSQPWLGLAKHYYYGPMFRYDRPQKGRLRQFHQIGLETVGRLTTPGHILESLMCALDFLDTLGLKHQVNLEINTLGASSDRAAYTQALTHYLSHQNLSPISLIRLKDNPLRILDSKDSLDRAACVNAPDLRSFINPQHRAQFETIAAWLAKTPFNLVDNPHLVRGLDYYTGFVFEITTPSLGAQKTVLAGGQYDGLSKLLGGPETQGMGWAAGIERLMLLTSPPPLTSHCLGLVVQSLDLIPQMWDLVFQLRRQGHTIETFIEDSEKNSLSSQMSRANKIGCPWVIILAEDELRIHHVILKNMRQGTQTSSAINALHETLTSLEKAT